MIGKYTNEELSQLHCTLYEILGEIDRVCRKLHIPYFLIGGSAIGAFFHDKGILPWDDDIDIGLTRDNYTRFIKEAPAELGADFFLQNIDSDPHSIYFFSKMMRRGTLFQEEDLVDLPVEQGIYIDVFPFDRVPDNRLLQRVQREACNFLNCALMATERWRWQHCGTCQIAHPTRRSWLMCFLTRLTITLLPKRIIRRWLDALLSLFNGTNTRYYNLVLFPRDHIPAVDVEHTEQASFGPLTVPVPAHLENYLRHHYPGLTRDVPKEQQMNHHPLVLKFANPSNPPEE